MLFSHDFAVLTLKKKNTHRNRVCCITWLFSIKCFFIYLITWKESSKARNCRKCYFVGVDECRNSTAALLLYYSNCKYCKAFQCARGIDIVSLLIVSSSYLDNNLLKMPILSIQVTPYIVVHSIEIRI